MWGRDCWHGSAELTQVSELCLGVTSRKSLGQSAEQMISLLTKPLSWLQ